MLVKLDTLKIDDWFFLYNYANDKYYLFQVENKIMDEYVVKRLGAQFFIMLKADREVLKETSVSRCLYR